MDKTELELSRIYLSVFIDRDNWTIDQHLAGLKAVFQAGAKAQRKTEIKS